MSMFPKCKHELAALEKRDLQNESGQPDVSKRIGIAKGKLKAPDDIDANGEEDAADFLGPFDGFDGLARLA